MKVFAENKLFFLFGKSFLKIAKQKERKPKNEKMN